MKKYLNYSIVTLLTLTLFVGSFNGILPVKKAVADVSQSDNELTQWRYDQNLLVQNGTFGNVVFDPVASIWRLFYQTAGPPSTIHQKTSINNRVFGNDVLALGVGSSGTWDEKETGVPYVWFEKGQSRPWRMIYRGCRSSNNLCQIGLATSTNGVNWERKDINGATLNNPVITSGATGQWDINSIDFGSIIKVGDTYYIYYDTINLNDRETGLATSTDLVHWTKNASNPMFIGVKDYSDKNHNGNVDLSAGFFCGDAVYWPRSDGSARYVYFTPHYASGHVTPSIDAYSSDSPVFSQANRTYLGVAFNGTDSANKIQGYQVKNADTPRIVTDDITRNVTTTTGTGDDVLMVLAVSNLINWSQTYLVFNKSFHGSTLSNINADLPINAPTFSLAPTGTDVNAKGLWLPGATGTLMDLTGGNTNLAGSYSNIDSNGINFNAANKETIFWRSPSGTIDALNSIQGDFSVETRVSLSSNFSDSFRGIIHYFAVNGHHHFYLYLSADANSNYSLNFSITSAGVTRNVAVPMGAINLNQMYRIAITKTNGRIYLFKDGVLLNAGGTTYDYNIDATPDAVLFIGSQGASNFWDGYIDEIRISNTARWTTNYIPTPLTYAHQTNGNIFMPVSDFGNDNNSPGQISLESVAPTNTTIIPKIKSASSNSDFSSNINDFSNVPQPNIKSQYQQFAISFSTSNTLTSPSISGASITKTKEDLTLNETASPTTGAPGTVITYTINYKNTSAHDITNLVITNPIPFNTTYVANSASNSGVLVNGSLFWNIDKLKTNDGGSIKFQVILN